MTLCLADLYSKTETSATFSSSHFKVLFVVIRLALMVYNNIIVFPMSVQDNHDTRLTGLRATLSNEP